MIVELWIEQIEIPQGLLPRVITGTIPEKVKEYAEMIENGVEFDPIKVWKRPDGKIWLIDGAHRIEAHKLAGKHLIKAELIRCENELDYRIRAIQENLKHGIQLLKEEKVILAQSLYKAGVSKERLQQIFGVSERTIYRWLQSIKAEEKEDLKRKAKELYEKGYSQTEIAKDLGVDTSTISRWLNEKDFCKIDTMSKMNINPPSEEESVATDDTDDMVDDMPMEARIRLFKEWFEWAYNEGRINERWEDVEPERKELMLKKLTYIPPKSAPAPEPEPEPEPEQDSSLPPGIPRKIEVEPKKKRKRWDKVENKFKPPSQIVIDYRDCFLELGLEMVLLFGKEAVIELLEDVLDYFYKEEFYKEPKYEFTREQIREILKSNKADVEDLLTDAEFYYFHEGKPLLKRLMK